MGRKPPVAWWRSSASAASSGNCSACRFRATLKNSAVPVSFQGGALTCRWVLLATSAAYWALSSAMRWWSPTHTSGGSSDSMYSVMMPMAVCLASVLTARLVRFRSGNRIVACFGLTARGTAEPNGKVSSKATRVAATASSRSEAGASLHSMVMLPQAATAAARRCCSTGGWGTLEIGPPVMNDHRLLTAKRRRLTWFCRAPWYLGPSGRCRCGIAAIPRAIARAM